MSNLPYMTGLFRDREDAERAYQAAMDRGYANDDINLVMSEVTRAHHFVPATATATTTAKGEVTTELGSKAAQGASVGGAIGGAICALAAAAAAIGTSLVIPGLGLVVAGPLVAALAGAGAGATGGGIIGAVVGLGIPEERVKRYETDIQSGSILIGLRPRSEMDAAYIAQVWRVLHGEQIYR